MLGALTEEERAGRGHSATSAMTGLEGCACAQPGG
jgi:hypothetical protein